MDESLGTCEYAFCKKPAVSVAGFDFSCLGVYGLGQQSRLCGDHLDVLRRRVEKHERSALVTWRSKDPEVPRGVRFFARKLLASPARHETEAVARALVQIEQAFTPREVRAGTVASAWIGLQLALQEARERRWNARRTAEWVEVVAFYGGLCAYCGDAAWAHVDHVVPLSRGGRDGIGNAVPACSSCSLRKSGSLGWTPPRRHRLLEVQESPLSHPSLANGGVEEYA